VKTSKVFFAPFLTVLFCAVAHAQPFQPPAPGQIGLSLSSTTTGSGKGKLNDGSTTYEDVGVVNYSCTINQRIPLGEQRNLTIGLDYDLTDISANGSAQLPLPDKLQSLGASLRYFQPIDQRWMFSTSVGAGSYVAESGLLSAGWGVRSSVIGIYNRSRQTSFMFGLAYNSLSQDLKVVPVLGFDWRPTEQWSVSIGFPRTGVTYKLNKQIALGLVVSGSGGAFYVKDDPRPGIAPRSLSDSKLQYMEARLGFNCDWKINETLRLSGTLGHVLYRQFKYIDRDYRLRSRDVVPFLSLAAYVRL
jgi:hypothetical protein